MRFLNRKTAGRALAKKLLNYKNKPDTLVLALPRGGVPVAFEIAKMLHLPLDILLVRKLGVPGHEELSMGAIASHQVQVLNEDIIRSLAIPPYVIKEIVAAEHRELERRNRTYRNSKPAPVIKDKTVILVDDGMATGANMRAAIDAVKQQQAAHIVVAVPVASDDAYKAIRTQVSEMICIDVAEAFIGVGGFYQDFSQTTDTEVKALLKQAS